MTMILSTAVLALACLAFWLFAQYSLWRHLRQAPPTGMPPANPDTDGKTDSGHELPPISVMKPIKGAFPGLYENLVSLAEQHYPEFELVFGVPDTSDPCLAEIGRLRRSHPGVKIRIVHPRSGIGLNPKVNCLNEIHRHCSHDLCLVSDADVRAPSNYLRTLAEERAHHRSHLVHNLICGQIEGRLGSSLEAVAFNDFCSPGVAGATALGYAPVVGKSMLFDRASLEQVGGWNMCKDMLAEDYILGRAFKAEGLRVDLSRLPLRVANPGRSIRAFAERHLRWSQMRCRTSVRDYLGELCMHPTLWSLLLCLAGWRALSLQATPLLGIFLMVLGVAAVMLRIRVLMWTHPALTGQKLALRHLPLIFLKDAILAGAWAAAWIDDRVNWKGTHLKIQRGTRLVAPDHLPESAIEPGHREELEATREQVLR